MKQQTYVDERCSNGSIFKTKQQTQNSSYQVMLDNDPEGVKLENTKLKKHNSDWNEVINDEDRNVFMKLCQVSNRTSVQKQRIQQNSKRLRIRQLLKQTVQDGEESKSGEPLPPRVEAQPKRVQQDISTQRQKMLPKTELSYYYESLIPNQFFDTIECSDSRVYGGKFTSRGNLFYASSQSHVMLFNTQDPYHWSLKKRILAQEVYWTVSDMDVDTQEQYMIYSTLSPVVQLVDLETLSAKTERISFAENQRDEGLNWYGQSGSAIMSTKFSGDTKEIVAGTKKAEVLVYDLISNRVSTRVNNAHDDEINSVCFANRETSNIIFTGSDDSMIKIWDRRALGNHREAGAFVGHSEGITHVSSKGDGVYVASNAKDQLLKVWDMRKLVTPERLARLRMPRSSGFDYRWGSYPLQYRQTKHAEDSSVFTFIGHEVMQTLIRCYFSPLETTGQRYVYTGSADGQIHIYDCLTGQEAMVLQSYQCKEVARDVSWHPHYPVIASTSFNGDINQWTLQNIDQKAMKNIFTKKDYEISNDDSESELESRGTSHQAPQRQPILYNLCRANITSLIFNRLRSLLQRGTAVNSGGMSDSELITREELMEYFNEDESEHPDHHDESGEDADEESDKE